jgi:SagB-type dehydrogenase family enzyme
MTTSDAVLWTYALAPDVKVWPSDEGAVLVTATSRTWVETGELEILERLAGCGSSETELLTRLGLSTADDDAKTRCGALLYRLDHLGLLARGLTSRGRRLVSCIPVRPPHGPLPEHPPDGPLRLSPHALARVQGNEVSLEAAGTWARTTIHDRELLPLLHDLAVGTSPAAIAAAAVGYEEEAILAVLSMLSWCGLLDRADDEGWSAHDLLFHSRTRRGYARVLLGKAQPWGEGTAPTGPETTVEGEPRLALHMPDLPRLLAEDPPHALVSQRRHSTRRHGSAPLTMSQLSEFLFRTLHHRGGRRPYPSGGACYPLQAYLAVHRCLGIARGLYAYDPARHELRTMHDSGPGLDELLADAASAANVAQTPQVLLVLAARYARTQQVYGDLSYSLILKETGAVFQTAMMAAAAMGLGACPLGSGNSLLFADLVGVNPLIEVSVGEMIVGSLEEAV